jgi:membrane peptidoglycan carboxypeptidase
LRGLPEIDLDDFQILPQASIITDREGNELFRFFDENRRRTAYEEINPIMLNAIIATEDQTFWLNQ